jgi:NAD-dependent deacetylase
MLPDGAMDEALGAVAESDLFLAVGTTLAVSPVNSMAWAAASAHIPIVIVNRGETEGDHLAAAKVDAAIDDVLPGLLAPAP